MQGVRGSNPLSSTIFKSKVRGEVVVRISMITEHLPTFLTRKLIDPK